MVALANTKDKISTRRTTMRRGELTMRKISTVTLIAIVIVTVVACSGQSTLPDGSYSFALQQEGNPFALPPLGLSFEVKGNVITAVFTETVSHTYEYIISGNEITLTDINGGETVLEFRKNNNTSYNIGGTNYDR
jgi:uncharacterized lipoprotein YehR (DUF1307 family)